MTSTATIMGTGTAGGEGFANNSTTRYFILAGRLHIITSTEANVQTILRTAGDFSRVGVRIQNSNSGGGGTLKFRKDTGGGGADGNNACTITANTAAWFEDSTPHIDTVAVGDKGNFAITSGTGMTNGLNIIGMTIKFLAASGAATYYGWFARGDSNGLFAFQMNSSISATRHYNVNISGGENSAEINAESAALRGKLRVGGVLSHIQTRVVGNAVTNATPFRYRPNNTNGNGTVSITASTTGTFEDTVNTDTVSVSDVACYAWDFAIEGTAHNLSVCFATGMFVPSVSGHDVMASRGTSSSVTGSTVANNFYNIFGSNSIRATTEADVQLKIPLAVTTGYLRCYVHTSQTPGLTFALRVNGSSVNQTLSLTASTTGIFEDTTHTDSIADGAALNYMHGAMVSIGGFAIAWSGLTFDPGSGIVPGNGSEVHHYNTVILG